MQSWPTGTVKTSQQLAEIGVGKGLALEYVKQGWLQSVGRGAYAKGQDQVTWLGGLYALQDDAQGHFHAGGRTALELLGYGHYASAKARPFFVFGPAKSRLPAWFSNHQWEAPLVFCATVLVPATTTSSFTEFGAPGFFVRVSTPERAILEMLHHVPTRVGFDEARELMTGLSTLRPSALQSLLEACNSIKVKRLFLYLAKVAGHKWFTALNQDLLDLGKGKRMIIKGGHLDKEYGITVPAVLGNGEQY